jgi:hypothetical protein
MYSDFNREAMYYEKDPMKMTKEEAKISVAYWRAKYEARCEVSMNIQSDLDRVIDLMEEEKNYRSQAKRVN